MAYKIFQRINEIQSADNIEILINNSIGNCHVLKGNRSNSFAMDLVQPYRIIFEDVSNTIKIVKILKIEDYH